MKIINKQLVKIRPTIYILLCHEYHPEVLQIHDFINKQQSITWDYIIWYNSESMIDIILDELKIYETNI
jgi:hypothetical protein